MDEKACRIGRRREGPARRSHRSDNRRRHSGDQATSASRRVAETELENNVGSDAVTHGRTRDIPAWAQACCEVRPNGTSPDRPAALDRGLEQFNNQRCAAAVDRWAGGATPQCVDENHPAPDRAPRSPSRADWAGDPHWRRRNPAFDGCGVKSLIILRSIRHR